MTDPRKDLATRYEIGVVPNEHGGYYGRVPDFPTIFTGGQTAEEAFRNALEAVELMLEEVEQRGQPVPEPLSAFSGRFNVRLPRSLHRDLVRRAESQGVSLNAIVSLLLSRAVGLEAGRVAAKDHRRLAEATAVAEKHEPYDGSSG